MKLLKEVKVLKSRVISSDLSFIKSHVPRVPFKTLSGQSWDNQGIGINPDLFSWTLSTWRLEVTGYSYRKQKLMNTTRCQLFVLNSNSKLHLNSTLTPLLNSSPQLGKNLSAKFDLNSTFWIPVFTKSPIGWNLGA